MDLGLKDKAVIVTGGGSNTGRAIVLGFAREGAKITIGDIDTAQFRRHVELHTHRACDHGRAKQGCDRVNQL